MESELRFLIMITRSNLILYIWHLKLNPVNSEKSPTICTIQYSKKSEISYTYYP
jgi:hypothetical protein